MSLAFIYFGDKHFNKFIAVDFAKNLSLEPEIMMFNSLNINFKSYPIDEIFLGWSNALFKVGRKLYCSGFQNSDCTSHAMEVYNADENDSIETASCGMEGVLFTTNKGKCYRCLTDDFTPRCIEFRGCKIKAVAANDIYTITLSENGEVYTIDIQSGIPLSVPLPCVVSKVACGKEHVLFLSKTGTVFSFGCGSRGQLGHGDIKNVDKPLVLEALDGLVMKNIAAGGWHSAAVSDAGDLYMWGWNESGQLGLPCIELQSGILPLNKIEVICCLPKHVEFKDDLEVFYVSCGSRHSAVITEDFQVWTCGWNAYGQLGKDCQLSDKFEVVQLPSAFVPRQITCNFWSTLISGMLRNI